MNVDDMQTLFIVGVFIVSLIALIRSIAVGKAVEGLTSFGEGLNSNTSLQNTLENRFKKLPLDTQQRMVDLAEGAELFTRNTENTIDDLFSRFLSVITDGKPNE